MTKPSPVVTYTPAELATVRSLRLRRNSTRDLDPGAYQAATDKEAVVHRDAYRRYIADNNLVEPQPCAAPAPKPVAQSKLAPTSDTPAAGKPARGEGVTTRIYQWCLDNPAATKKDAQAAFPSANPGTVGVQFGKARNVRTSA